MRTCSECSGAIFESKDGTVIGWDGPICYCTPRWQPPYKPIPYSPDGAKPLLPLTESDVRRIVNEELDKRRSR